MEEYRTLFQEASHRLLIKKSEFIAFAAACQTEEEAQVFVDRLRRQHPQARHCVYAWRIGGYGSKKFYQRYSDDGEPQGTGGLPVLKNLSSSEITDACVAVIRYFGGILLGTGALSRAYGKTAAEALHVAGVTRMQLKEIYSFALPYTAYSSLRHAIRRWDLTLLREDFAQDVHVSLAIWPEQREDFFSLIADLTSGLITADYVESVYVADQATATQRNGREETDAR